LLGHICEPKERKMTEKITEEKAIELAVAVRATATAFTEAVKAAREAGLHVEIEVEDRGGVYAPSMGLGVWQPR
jgi:hypothetical protein